MGGPSGDGDRAKAEGATVFEELAELDKLVHEPARLAILTALSACRQAEFVFLLGLTRLTRGNLSSHLSRLEEAGLVEIEKRFVDRKPNTLVSLTAHGRRAIERHWRRLDELREGARSWTDDRAGT